MSIHCLLVSFLSGLCGNKYKICNRETDVLLEAKLSLSEVQDVLMSDVRGDGAQNGPLLVFVPNKSPNEDKPGGFTSADHRYGLMRYRNLLGCLSECVLDYNPIKDLHTSL